MTTKLIEASAGTGKTHRLVDTYVATINKGAAIDSIVVVTFTRAATAELRGRIRRRLRDVAAAPDAAQNVRDALAAVDSVRIQTIHSFCAAMLQRHGFSAGETLGSATEGDELTYDFVEGVLRDVWASAWRDLPWMTPAPPWAAVSETCRAVRLAGAETQIVGFPSGDALRATAAALLAEAGAVCAQAAADRDAMVAALLTHGNPDRTRFNTPYKAAEALVEATDATIAAAQRFVGLSLDAALAAVGETQDVRLPTAATLAGKMNRQSKANKDYPFDEDAFSEFAVVRWFDAWDGVLKKLRLRVFVEAFERGVHARKQTSDRREHDDFVAALARAVAPTPEVPVSSLARAIAGHTSCVLVDEFQDTDPQQASIFGALAAAGVDMTYVGDPKQAIYSFRGADVGAYLDVRRALPASAVETLKKTYRADLDHQRAIDHLFTRLGAQTFGTQAIAHPAAIDSEHPTARLQDPESADAAVTILYVPEADDDGPIQVDGKWTHWDFCYRVAAEIRDLVARGATIDDLERDAPAVDYGDIAVLTRTNRQAADVVRACRTLGLPVTRLGDSSVLDTPEAEELAHVLEAVAAPEDPGAVRRALATEMIGCSAAQIRALGDDPGVGRIVACLQRWRAHWEERGFLAAFGRAMVELNVEARLRDQPDGPRRLTDLRHLAELLAGRLGGQSTTPRAAVAELHRALDTELDPDAADARRVDTTAGAVRVLTLHKSKGLTFPIVFCPYLWKDRPRKAGAAVTLREVQADGSHQTVVAVAPSTEQKHAAFADQHAESLRLAYVGLTRAQHRTYLCAARWPDSAESPLGWLLLQESPVPPLDAEALRQHVSALRVVTKDEPDEWLRRIEARAGAAATVAARPIARMPDLRALSGAAATPSTASAPAVDPAEVRALPSALRTAWFPSSFSRLLHRDGGGVDDDAAVGTAFDSEPAAAQDGSLEPRGAWSLANADLYLKAANKPAPFADFPRGRHAGDFLHAIFERVDFQRDDAWPGIVSEQLQRFPLGRANHPQRRERAAVRLVADVVQTPLYVSADHAFSLDAVPPRDRLNEARFEVQTPPTSPRAFVEAIGQAIDRHGSSLSRPYGKRLIERAQSLSSGTAALPAIDVTGAIDLVFRQQGRWYVADWKSNHCGPLLSDYRVDALQEKMVAADYVLQAHLYLVAVHRHLRRCLPSYAYERDFGGVFYLFVRGMHASTRGHTGVWFDRPPGALVDALDALFAAPQEARR